MISSNVIAVFARAPQPGTVKTRLQPRFDATSVAALYCAMLRDCLGIAQEAAAQIHDCGVCVVFTPEDAFAPGPHSLAPFWNGPRMVQSHGDLGEKMQSAFHTLCERGAAKVVLIGSDSPDLPPQLIRQAFASLNASDLVFGPACDGGFYLIGASREVPPALFAGVPWSAANTLQHALCNVRREQLSFSLLPEWNDVDEIEDIFRLAERLKQSNAAPYTRGLLASQNLPTASES